MFGQTLAVVDGFHSLSLAIPVRLRVSPTREWPGLCSVVSRVEGGDWRVIVHIRGPAAAWEGGLELRLWESLVRLPQHAAYTGAYRVYAACCLPECGGRGYT